MLAATVGLRCPIRLRHSWDVVRANENPRTLTYAVDNSKLTFTALCELPGKILRLEGRSCGCSLSKFEELGCDFRHGHRAPLREVQEKELPT